MSLPRTKKFKIVPSAGKVVLTLFWDFNGPIPENYQDYGQVANNAMYCAMLEEKLKLAIPSKCRMLTNGIVLHHDNALPHTAAARVEKIRNLKFKLLLRPVYSPDLNLFDYHIFGWLKDALHGY